jgi:hypothetical protein
MATPKFLKDYGVALSLFGALLIAYVAGFITISGQIAQQGSSLHEKIDNVNKDLTAQIGKVDTRATKLEGAVKALGDNQQDPLKGLVRDLLAVAANALPQKPDLASRAIRVSDSVIATLKRKKEPADADFFKETVSSIEELHQRIPAAKPAGPDHFELRIAVFATRISLAEYRSSVEPPPKTQGTWFNYTKPLLAEGIVNSSIRGINLDFTAIKEGIVLGYNLERKGLLSDNILIENAAIQAKGGGIVLDGVHWRNVAIFGANIIYRGGQVELQNVQFVNCTFEVTRDSNGQKFVNFAALAGPYLVVPS